MTADRVGHRSGPSIDTMTAMESFRSGCYFRHTADIQASVKSFPEFDDGFRVGVHGWLVSDAMRWAPAGGGVRRDAFEFGFLVGMIALQDARAEVHHA